MFYRCCNIVRGTGLSFSFEVCLHSFFIPETKYYSTGGEAAKRAIGYRRLAPPPVNADGRGEH